MTAKPKKTASTTGKTCNSANSGAKRNTGGARRKRGNTASGNDFDRMKSVHLWPDENDQVFAEYRKEVLDGLAPDSPYEQNLAEDIFAHTWDIKRMRRLRDTMLNKAVEEQFDNRFKQMIRTYYGGKREEFDELMIDPKWSKEKELEETLRCMGVTMPDLIAEAYDGPVGSPRTREKIDPLDCKIADLEIRRRRLVADYEKLWDKNRKHKGTG